MPVKSVYDRSRLSRLLLDQFGVVSRSQALECGLSRGRVDHLTQPDGRWQRILPGVYAATTGTVTVDQRAMAALLYAGLGSLITGAAAVRRHNLRCAGLNEVDVLVPVGMRRQSTEFVRIIHTSRMPRSCCSTDGIRFALLDRAVADAARGMTRLSDVRAVVAEAIQRGRCDLASLITELNEGSTAGSRFYRVALAEISEGIRSAAEADMKHAEEARAKPLAFSALADLADGMWRADLDFSAFRAMAEIAESPSWWRGFFHLIMGETLMKRGFARSALNHLSWCVTVRLDGSLEQDSALGAAFLDQAREDMSIAQRVIAQGGGTISAVVELRPRRSDIRCDICGSRYSAAGWACALCGTLHAAGVNHCAMCGHDVISMRKLWFCPVCRTSFKNVHGQRIQSMLLSRRPGERFSVLWPYAKPVQNPFAGA